MKVDSGLSYRWIKDEVGFRNTLVIIILGALCRYCEQREREEEEENELSSPCGVVNLPKFISPTYELTGCGAFRLCDTCVNESM